jgi:hypothetical protein
MQSTMIPIPYGGTIDRGVIISVSQDGARVLSYTKPGVVTRPLKATFVNPMQVGWQVFYVDYEDGRGAILSHIQPEITQHDGLQGPEGPVGPQGPIGPTGVQGLKGDKGDTGATGPQGVTGATGSQGPQGVKGDKGDTGAAGPQGATGATGAQGIQGPAGHTPTITEIGAVSKTGDAMTGTLNNSAMYGLIINPASGECSIQYNNGSTMKWVVGKGPNGIGDNFGWYYAPAGGNKMTLSTSGDLTLASGIFTTNLNSRYYSVGCGNTAYAHHNTNADYGHWFNKDVRVAGNLYAGTNYDQLVLNLGNYTSYCATSGHTHNYAGSGSASGNAYAANKLAVTADFVPYTALVNITSGDYAGFNGWASHLHFNHGDSSYYQDFMMPYWGAPQYSRLEGGAFRGPFTLFSTENTTFGASPPTASFVGQVFHKTS